MNLRACLILFSAIALLAPKSSHGACPFESWLHVRNEPGERLGGVTFANGRFIAVGVEKRSDNNNYSLILTSDDALRWEKVRIDLSTNYLGNVAYLAGNWVVWSRQGNLLHSTDTVNWTKAITPLASIQTLATGGGKFLAMEWNGAAALSEEGTNWTRIADETRNYFTRLVFDGAQFLAVGSQVLDSGNVKGLLQSSSDGVSWEIHPGPWAWHYGFDSIAVGNNLTVLSSLRPGFVPPNPGDELIFYVSPDRVTWTELGFRIEQKVEQFDFLNGSFVARLSNDYFLTSSDGLFWRFRSPVAMPLHFNPQAVAFGNDRFVVVGQKGILVSEDVIVPCLHQIEDAPSFTLELSGKVGVDYAIDRSFDLTQWIQWTNFTAEVGFTQLHHNISDLPQAAFFRAKVLTPQPQ